MENEPMALSKIKGDEITTDVSINNESKIIDLYRGASSKPVTQKQQDQLLSPIEPKDVEIKPDGSPYLPQVKYRRKLNQTFGPMGWALMAVDDLKMKGNVLYRRYVLIVGDRYVAEAIGSQQYFENNPNMDYADAAEGVKSNALERCCKDLGVASELWDPNYINQWKSEYAVQVMAPIRGQMKKLWRRKDRPQFDGEGKQIEKPEVITNKQSQDQSPLEYNEPPPEHNNSGSKPLITDKQRKRMYAIARNAGFNDEQFKDELIRMGFESSADVTIDVYNDICSHFESFGKQA